MRRTNVLYNNNNKKKDCIKVTALFLVALGLVDEEREKK